MGNSIINYVKFIGYILMIVSISFIINKILTMNVDFGIIFHSKNIIAFCVIVCLNILLILVSCMPWMIIVSTLSQKNIQSKSTLLVYMKSNIMKYIPGNVFQYVGRDELAIKTGIDHADVAVATLIDIGMIIIVTILIPMLLMREYAIEQIILNGQNIFTFFGLVIGLAFVIVAVCFIKCKGKLLEYTRKYAKLITLETALKFLFCFIFYSLYFIILGGVYISILVLMLDQKIEFQLLMNLIGAINLSWVIGFMTPGAPGGIGIREAVMTLVAGSLINGKIIIQSMIIFRFINILSDIGALVVIYFVNAVLPNANVNSQ